MFQIEKNRNKRKNNHAGFGDGQRLGAVRGLAVLLSLLLCLESAPLTVLAAEPAVSEEQPENSDGQQAAEAGEERSSAAEQPGNPDGQQSPSAGDEEPAPPTGEEKEPPAEEEKEPSTGEEKEPSTGEGETPSAGEEKEPPAGEGDTPSSGEEKEPPSGEEQPPADEEKETVSENDVDQVSENDISSVSENELETVSENSLDAEREALIKKAQEAFDALVSEKPLMALLYHTDSYEARREADAHSGTAAALEIGETLYIQGVEITEDDVWYRAQYLSGGAEGTGYVQSYYLAYADEDWLVWEEEYLLPILELGEDSYQSTAYGMQAYSMMPYAVASSEIGAFPGSYQSALQSLKNAHPNWTFVPMRTGLDFNASVSAEMGDKSLIQKTDANVKNGWVGNPCPSESGWNYATQSAVAYHMDPRNFLTETYIFQFEQLTYNGSYHTESAVQNFLNGTFMKGKLADDAAGRTYAGAFFEIGKNRKLSPTHLAARVYQEQGNGTSGLISGTYPGYEGYYNFFNVGVNGASTAEKIVKGLTYAKNKGWNTRYKSLEGGAATIGNNYILKGQDTIYLEKFNVNKSSPYGVYAHQYMQNIQAPRSESASTKKIYNNAGSLNSAFVFKIPVYDNMPNETEEPDEPVEPENPDVPLQSISLDKETLTLMVGQSQALYVTYVPEDTTDDRTVIWSSSNAAVAAVKNGRVTAMGTGKATVTAKAAGCVASCEVSVKACRVIFHKEDGAVLKALSLGYGGCVADAGAFPELPNAAGKIFRGWYTKEDGQGSVFTETQPVYAEETHVYPHYQKIGTQQGFYVIPVGTQTYTGSAIKPKLQVFDSAVAPDGSLIGEGQGEVLELVEGRDYTLSYKNNKNVNAEGKARPVVTVKGKGNYAGTQQVFFDIVPKALTDADITADDVTAAYSGRVIKSAPTVWRGGKKLQRNTDYTVTHPHAGAGAYQTAGVYPIVIKGKGGYSGTITVYETITKKTLMSKVSVARIPDQTYSGEQLAQAGGIRPASLKVTYKKEPLVESTDGGKTGDYTVVYTNDTAIGTATATITAVEGSAYTSSRSVTYKIVGTSISRAKVEGIEAKVYPGAAGSVQQSGYTLTLGDQTLSESKDGGRTGDYVVSYAGAAKSGAVKAGTATIIFQGIHAYSGQLKKTYKIQPYPFDEAEVGGDITLTYHTQDAPGEELALSRLNGMTTPYVKGGSKPVISVSFRGQPLVQGKDYTVSYRNNNALTTAETEEKKLPAFTVTGRGNFKGKLTGTFTITDGRLNKKGKVTMILKDVVYREKKNAYKAKVTLKDVNGASLAAGRDYDKILQYEYAKDAVVLVSEEGTLVERERKAGESVGEEDIPKAGTVIRVTAKGIGAYAGENGLGQRISGSYRIVAADIVQAKVTVKAQDYQDGRPVTLTAEDLTLTVSGVSQPLQYGVDFTIDRNTYYNHTNKGKAKVTLRGLGNYGGEKTITYNIGAKSLWW